MFIFFYFFSLFLPLVSFYIIFNLHILVQSVGGCQPRVSTSCAMEKWRRGEHILLVSTGPSNSFLTSTRRVLSCHKYLSAILFSVSFSLLLWVLPTKCLYSLTSTKGSSTTVAVSRSYLQGSLHSWSGSYQKSNHFSSPSHHWHCPLSSKRLWHYLHYSSLLVRAACGWQSSEITSYPWDTVQRPLWAQQETYFLGTIHCFSSSWGVWPWDPQISHRLCGGNYFFMLPPIIFLSMILKHKLKWIGLRGDHLSEIIILNSVLKLYNIWHKTQHIVNVQ